MKNLTITDTLKVALQTLSDESLRRKATLAHRRGWDEVLADIGDEFRRRRQRAGPTKDARVASFAELGLAA